MRSMLFSLHLGNAWMFGGFAWRGKNKKFQQCLGKYQIASESFTTESPSTGIELTQCAVVKCSSSEVYVIGGCLELGKLNEHSFSYKPGA